MTATIKNLCKNPKLKPADLTVETGCILTYTGSDNALHVTSTGSSAGRVLLPPIDITPYYGQSMVMSVETSGSGTVGGAALCYVRFNNTNLTLSEPPAYLHGAAWPVNRVTWMFNCLDKASGATTLTPVLTSMSGNGNTVHYARLIVCTQEDYTKLLTTGLKYFDYSTRPE